MSVPRLRFDQSDIEQLSAALEFRFRYIAKQKLFLYLHITNSGRLYAMTSLGNNTINGDSSSGTALKIRLEIPKRYDPAKLVKHISQLGLDDKHRDLICEYLLENKELVKLSHFPTRVFWSAWSIHLTANRNSWKWLRNKLLLKKPDSPNSGICEQRKEKWERRLKEKGATWEDVHLYDAANAKITCRLFEKVFGIHYSEKSVLTNLQRTKSSKTPIA